LVSDWPEIKNHALWSLGPCFIRGQIHKNFNVLADRGLQAGSKTFALSFQKSGKIIVATNFAQFLGFNLI
jgi:hypothetical protein